MAWQEIGAGEVDANSPVSATLMGKVRNNLYWLYGQFKITLFNNSDEYPEPSEYYQQAQGNEWVDVSGIRNAQIKIYCPNLVKNIKIYCRTKSPSQGTRKLRVKVVETEALSNEYSYSGVNWATAEFTITDPGSGFITLQYQSYGEYSADFYLHWQVVLVEGGQ